MNVNLQPQIRLKQFYIPPSVSEKQQNETYELTGIFTYDPQLVSDRFPTVRNKHGISVWVQSAPVILFPTSTSDNTYGGHIRRPRIFQQKTVATLTISEHPIRQASKKTIVQYNIISYYYYYYYYY